MAEPRIIKKYSNRKLYDTAESRYITLDDIARLVQSRVEIKVIDNKTGEDLSRQTLAQVVLDQEKKRRTLLPISELRELILKGSDSLFDVVRRGLDAGVEAIHLQEMREVLERVGQGRQMVESRVEEAVQQAVGRITQRQDLRQIEERLARLEAELASVRQQLEARLGDG